MSSQNSYFPAFLSFSNKKILIIGGGKIANDKLSKLLDFTENIKLISKEFTTQIKSKIKQYNLEYEIRDYQKGDILGFDIIIVAVDDIDLQKTIYHESRDTRALINSVDNKEYCDFIFGSYIKKDDLIISISTSGNSPSLAKYLKIFLEKSLPDNILDFLKQLKMLRKSLPKGKERMQLLDKRVKEFFDLVQ